MVATVGLKSFVEFAGGVDVVFRCMEYNNKVQILRRLFPWSGQGHTAICFWFGEWEGWIRSFFMDSDITYGVLITSLFFFVCSKRGGQRGEGGVYAFYLYPLISTANKTGTFK